MDGFAHAVYNLAVDFSDSFMMKHYEPWKYAPLLLMEYKRKMFIRWIRLYFGVNVKYVSWTTNSPGRWVVVSITNKEKALMFKMSY